MSDHVRMPWRVEQGDEEISADSLSPADLHTPAPQKTTDSLIQSTLFADDAVRSAAAPSELPESIGRFTSLHLLGHGGFGFVFRAYDPELKRLVALKVPKTGVVAEPFLEEARAAAQLKHENIVTVYDVGRSADDQIFIAMEFVDGPTLSVQMRQQPFSHVEAAQLVARVARAVAFAHESDIVHRDLKPGNILIAKDGTPKVGDFGLACYENGEPLQEGEVAGTPAYMAPEQVSGTMRQIDRRTDIWSLGVILYQLLCGQPPFEGSRHELFEQIAKGKPKPLRSIDATIPQSLEAICGRCLSKSPADRPQSALDLSKELERICASYDETRVALPLPLLQQDDDRPPVSPSRPVLWGTLVCAVLLLGWLGRSLWSGPGAPGLNTLPDEDVVVVAVEPQQPERTTAERLLEDNRSAILKPRDPRWASLLRGKITPVLWREQDPQDSWVFDDQTDRLAVHCRGAALFGVGTATSETASLRTTFYARQKESFAGVFWGLHERVDRTKACRFVLARGELSEQDSAEAQIGELELTHTPLGWIVTLRHVWFTQPITMPDDHELDLQVDLEDGLIQQVLVDKVPVIEAGQLGRLEMPKVTTSGRRIGLLADGTTVLFKSYYIRE